jgi:hypothetical protein
LLIIDLDTPVIVVSNVSPKEGENVTFTCDVNNTDVINGYEWYHDGTKVSNGTSNQYVLTNGDRSNTGNYYCNVTSQSFQRQSATKSVIFLCKYTCLNIRIIKVLEAAIQYFNY